VNSRHHILVIRAPKAVGALCRQRLIRIGDNATVREDDAARRAYFAADYVFHGPGGD
jgi:hypothetical protein